MTPLRNWEDLSSYDHERLARAVMKRQAGLSVRVASIFVVLVLGLPLVNYAFPEVANTSIGGFTATWLFLGVLIYPIVVALSFYFVRHSDTIEAECADWRKILELELEEESNA